MTSTRYKELEGVLEAKRSEIKSGLDNGVRIDGSNIEIKSEDYAALQGKMREIEEIKSLMVMEALPTDAKSIFDGSATDMESKAMRAAAEAALGGAPGGYGSGPASTLGEMFVKSDAFKDFQKTGRATMDEAWEIKSQDVAGMGTFDLEKKDVYTGLLSGSLNPRGFGSIQFDPAVPRAQRTARVRNLFSVASTSANLIDYFRVLGFAEGENGAGNAKTVAERTMPDGTVSATASENTVFGLKPKSNLRFQSAQAPVRTIAHWEAAHRNVIADEPQLQSTINNELLYGLALAEDDQILNGDGQGDNLLGILNTQGIQTYTQATGDRPSDALRRAATLCVIANYAGTGFVLHPFDWEEIELQKATGDGQYMLVSNVAVGAETRVWRQPVVETPAMEEKTFLTGAFGIGAQLYDRQTASVRIAEQHADFFVRNAVVVLCEERLALAVKRPESFVKGTFL